MSSQQQGPRSADPLEPVHVHGHADDVTQCFDMFDTKEALQGVSSRGMQCRPGGP